MKPVVFALLAATALGSVAVAQSAAPAAVRQGQTGVRHVRLRRGRHGQVGRAGRRFLQLRQRRLGRATRRSPPTNRASARSRCCRTCPTSAPAGCSKQRRPTPIRRSAGPTRPISTPRRSRRRGWRRSSRGSTGSPGSRRRTVMPRCWSRRARAGVGTPFGSGVTQDAKNPDVYAVALRQSGLGMPDRDYYLSADPKLAETKTAYVAHIAKMLTLAGEADARPARAGDRRFRNRHRQGELDADRKPRRRQDVQQDDRRRAGQVWRQASISPPISRRRARPTSSSASRARSPASPRWSVRPRCRCSRISC